MRAIGWINVLKEYEFWGQAYRKNLLGGGAMRSLNCALLSILLVAVFSTALFGQEFTGHVKDASGAALSGATVIVHNELTNQDIKTKTTAAGDYTVPYLKAGQYSVTAEMQGFEKQM